MKNYIPTDLGLLGAFGLLIYGGVKLYQVAKKLDMSVTDLSKKTPVEISDAAVNSAVEKAVERETKVAVGNATRQIVDGVRGEMEKEVRAEVKSQYDNISDKVTDQISEEVGKINETDLRQQVSKKAEKIVLNKLEHSTDEAIANMNRGLGKIISIYDGISDRLNGDKKHSSGGGLRLLVD